MCQEKYLETERAAVVKVDLETVVISSPGPLDRVCPVSQSKRTGDERGTQQYSTVVQQ